MLNEFELDYNAAEATKNICCVKGEDAVDLNTVTWWFNKARSSRLKIVDSEALFNFLQKKRK